MSDAADGGPVPRIEHNMDMELIPESATHLIVAAEIHQALNLVAELDLSLREWPGWAR